MKEDPRHERGSQWYLKTPRAPGSPAALKISCPSHSSAFPGATGYSLVSVLATEVLKKRNRPWLAASTSSFGGTEGELVGSSVGGVYSVLTLPALLSSTRPAGQHRQAVHQRLVKGMDPGLRPPGRPRSSFNDVALHDCQTCRLSRPYRDAQDRLLWKDKTCSART